MFRICSVSHLAFASVLMESIESSEEAPGVELANTFDSNLDGFSVPGVGFSRANAASTTSTHDNLPELYLYPIRISVTGNCLVCKVK